MHDQTGGNYWIYPLVQYQDNKGTPAIALPSLKSELGTAPSTVKVLERVWMTQLTCCKRQVCHLTPMLLHGGSLSTSGCIDAQERGLLTTLPYHSFVLPWDFTLR